MAAPKGFNRKYEASFGHLKPSQFPSCIKWDNKEHVQLLFPTFKREQIKNEKKKGAAPSKRVEINNFCLQTPTKDKDLFVNTKLLIEPSTRCALYGENGSGKTMLFHSLATGQVLQFPPSISVHHMQEMSMDPAADDVSVMDTIVSSHPLLRVLAGCEKKLQNLIKGAKHSFDEAGLKSNLAYVQQMLKTMKYEDAETEVSKMLRVLGFDEKGEAAPMSSLSGGLRMRVALASAFFINAELLLLDEPTNHLDLPSVLWLENKLRAYKGAFMLVTHDRHLLENTVRSVMQLTDLTIKPYSCGFGEFEKRRTAYDESMNLKIEKFLKINKNIDPTSPEFLIKKRYQAWQQKLLKRQIAMAGKFTFKEAKPLPCPAGTKQKDISLIKIENVRFSYNVEAGLPYIFDTPISYEITQGTRVGIMGPNGAGKSTLLKLITAKIFPTEGTVTRNPDFTLAYFGQHSTKELNMDHTPLEFMTSSFPKGKKGDIMGHLEKTTIDSQAMNTRMNNLSFSQRSCVIFAKLTFIPPHLLIMDEPTNFLDLDSVDALISAANKFPGALITVTHNRDFLKRCSKDFLSLVPGAFLQFSSMKDAERATYSFIDALEKGEDVDHKQAIQENRGGGAVHTEEYLAAQEARRNKILADAAKREAAEAKLAAEALAIAEAKAAAALKKKNSQKLDWAAGDECWAPVGKGWKKGVVKRNIPAMGVTVELPGGVNKMIPAKKLKQENPDAGKVPEAKAAGGRGQGQKAAGGRGGRGKSTARGGGRGGQQSAGGRGRGGGRGGGRR